MRTGKMILTALVISSTAAIAQKPMPATKGFTQLPGGVEYKIAYNKPGTLNPKNGDYVEAHMYVEVDGEMIYNSRQVNENKPVSFVMTQPKSKTDIQEVIKLLSEGDSVVIKFSVDSLIKSGVDQLRWMKPNTGQKATYFVKMVQIKQMGSNVGSNSK
ncbi:MAG: hypothetical protein KDC07_05810 [Chitinophagaceae bacterium]|nr:hypothetical protein [Chitinophagaceae bacterium]